MDFSNKPLEDCSSELKSRTDFIQFIYALKKDLEKNPDEWENCDLRTYLNALAAFLGDANGYYKNAELNVSADDPSWRVFADCMMAARVYD